VSFPIHTSSGTSPPCLPLMFPSSRYVFSPVSRPGPTLWPGHQTLTSELGIEIWIYVQTCHTRLHIYSIPSRSRGASSNLNCRSLYKILGKVSPPECRVQQRSAPVSRVPIVPALGNSCILPLRGCSSMELGSLRDFLKDPPHLPPGRQGQPAGADSPVRSRGVHWPARALVR
jgi:hypothetical protein